jgi:hypothetical protein
MPHLSPRNVVDMSGVVFNVRVCTYLMGLMLRTEDECTHDPNLLRKQCLSVQLSQSTNSFINCIKNYNPVGEQGSYCEIWWLSDIAQETAILPGSGPTALFRQFLYKWQSTKLRLPFKGWQRKSPQKL